MNTGVQETLWFEGQFSALPYLFQWIRVSVKLKSRNANDIKDTLSDRKRLSGDILRCVPFCKLYHSDPHSPGVSGTCM